MLFVMSRIDLHGAELNDMKALNFILTFISKLSEFTLHVLQEDKSTPLHFACAQGSLEMIKVMKEIQPEKFLSAATTTDILRMTPLHRAAMFNHTEVMRFLLDEVLIQTDVSVF